MKHALIISDKKPGLFNQSIAIAKIMNWEYTIIDVKFKNKFYQLISYIFDFINISVNFLFSNSNNINNCDIVISTGSTTYYANKYFAKKFNVKNIAVLLPRIYRLNFNHIICPKYDFPPKKDCITEIPANICYSKLKCNSEEINRFSESFEKNNKKYVGIIIGGNSSKSKIYPENIKKQINDIFTLTPNHEHWITTSRRTPSNIEQVIKEYKFEYKLLYSENKNVNPVPAFIQLCDHIFVTADSSSMISEVISSGSANITIIPVNNKKILNKFNFFIKNIVDNGCASILSSTLNTNNKKINSEIIIKNLLKDL